MKILSTLIIICLIFVSVIHLNLYSIPQLIPEDYDCEEHPGFISDSNPAPFEPSQHYVNRKNKAVIKQIEEVCG